LVGPFGRAASFFWASLKLLDRKGQKVGKGHAVKKKVKPSAWPLNCPVLTASPKLVGEMIIGQRIADAQGLDPHDPPV